jgi:hypothetical protein
MEDTMVGLISGSVSGLSGRIYPMILPQDATLPACTYQRIDTMIEVSHDNNQSVQHPRVQFSVYDKRYGTARTQAEAIRDLFNGLISGSFQATFIENVLDDVEEETQLRKSIVDIVYWGNI